MTLTELEYNTQYHYQVKVVDTEGFEIIKNVDIYIPVNYKYWNNNFAGYSYKFASNTIPTGTGLQGTYDSRNALASAYTSFSSTPVYIRTTLLDNTPAKHDSCLWYNNREFCLGPNYWTGTIGVEDATAGANTKNKLKADMEAALGISASSCTPNRAIVSCTFGSLHCDAYYYGTVYCAVGNSRYCYVDSDGTAFCS